MEIKRLLTRGGIPFAAEIVDGTEQYKVFIESLGNTVILPELIKSGWKLVALPLSLMKNGVALEDLPKIEYSPSVAEEQDMYDLMGIEMSMEERKKLLVTTELRVEKLPTGSYTINTREEFLSYLENTVERRMPEEFLPINYFVHPAALFTWKEYTDPENKKWVDLLTRRRVLSYPQFVGLRSWALRNGLKPDFTAADFVSYYFQWGICGLNTPILSRSRRESSIMRDLVYSNLDVTKRVPTMKAYGLIDRFQNEYRAPGTERYTLSNSNNALRASQLLTDNRVAVVPIQTPVYEVIEEWETADINISFGARYLMLGGLRLNSITVEGTCGFLSNHLWNPAKRKEMNDDMFLHAMAEEFIEKRKCPYDVSSYKALCESGCSPFSALIYMKDVLGLDKRDPLQTDEQVMVTQADIYNFLCNEPVASEVANIITDIMEGVTNIDQVQAGMRADMNRSADNLYAQLYCAYHVLNVPLKTIYNEITNFAGNEPLTFTDGKVVLEIDSSPIDAAYKGFLADKAAYRKTQAEKADNFLWVDTVARELGPESANRHIAVYGYTAARNKNVTACLYNLKSVFESKVESEIADPRMRSAYLDFGDMFAVNAFFTSALYGYYTFPAEITKEVVRIPENERSYYRAQLKGPVIEDTVSIADDAVYPSFNGDWKWYCVNAVVQPTKVTPRRNFTIRETSLVAVWNDYSGLPVYNELLQRGLVRPNEMCWSYTYGTSPIYTVATAGRGLRTYYINASTALDEYDRTLRFVGVPHLLETAYPYFQQEMLDVGPAAATEEYKFKVGKGAYLTYKEEAPEQRTDTRTLYKYTKLSAEDFYFTGGDVTFPTPTGKKPFSVIYGSLYADGKEIRPADVENLDTDLYPITHICGRRYLLCDVLGTYWIVEV